MWLCFLVLVMVSFLCLSENPLEFFCLPFEEEFWLIDEDVGVLTGEDRGDVILESHQQGESECLALWLKKARVLGQVT